MVLSLSRRSSGGGVSLVWKAGSQLGMPSLSRGERCEEARTNGVAEPYPCTTNPESRSSQISLSFAICNFCTSDQIAPKVERRRERLALMMEEAFRMDGGATRGFLPRSPHFGGWGGGEGLETPTFSLPPARASVCEAAGMLYDVRQGRLAVRSLAFPSPPLLACFRNFDF